MVWKQWVETVDCRISTNDLIHIDVLWYITLRSKAQQMEMSWPNQTTFECFHILPFRRGKYQPFFLRISNIFSLHHIPSSFEQEILRQKITSNPISQSYFVEIIKREGILHEISRKYICKALISDNFWLEIDIIAKSSN